MAARHDQIVFYCRYYDHCSQTRVRGPDPDIASLMCAAQVLLLVLEAATWTKCIAAGYTCWNYPSRSRGMQRCGYLGVWPEITASIAGGLAGDVDTEWGMSGRRLAIGK